MSNKNSHYKLDFKIAREKENGGNLTFRDFRRRYYWSSADKWATNVIEKIVADLTLTNSISSLIPANFDIDAAVSEADIAYSKTEKLDFFVFTSLGRAEWYKQVYAVSNGAVTSKTAEKHQALCNFLASKTDKYQAYENEFKKWLDKRPGLKEVWEEMYDDEPTLIRFAKATGESSFRTKVENARPRTLKIGTLVQLKDKFIKNSNKDPFYWIPAHGDSPRLGMISKFDEDNAFGYGSRLLKIMWIATGEETLLMERELKILSE